MGLENSRKTGSMQPRGFWRIQRRLSGVKHRNKEEM